MLNKILAACGILVITVMASAAIAADKGGEPAVVPLDQWVPAPAYRWGGIYIGAHGGFDVSDTNETAIGIHVGAMRQFGNLVAGIEGSATAASVAVNTSKTTSELLAVSAYSATASLGLAFDRALVYGRAGYTWAEGAEGPTYGGGVALGLTNNIVVGAEVMRTELDSGAPALTTAMGRVSFKF